jgi:hypothetical protein
MGGKRIKSAVTATAIAALAFWYVLDPRQYTFEEVRNDRESWPSYVEQKEKEVHLPNYVDDLEFITMSEYNQRYPDDELVDEREMMRTRSTTNRLGDGAHSTIYVFERAFTGNAIASDSDFEEYVEEHEVVHAIQFNQGIDYTSGQTVREQDFLVNHPQHGQVYNLAALRAVIELDAFAEQERNFTNETSEQMRKYVSNAQIHYFRDFLVLAQDLDTTFYRETIQEYLPPQMFSLGLFGHKGLPDGNRQYFVFLDNGEQIYLPEGIKRK